MHDATLAGSNAQGFVLGATVLSDDGAQHVRGQLRCLKLPSLVEGAQVPFGLLSLATNASPNASEEKGC